MQWPLLPLGTPFYKGPRMLWELQRMALSYRQILLCNSLSTANMHSSTRCRLSSLSCRWGVKVATNVAHVVMIFRTWPILTSTSAWLTRTVLSNAHSA